MDSQLSRRELIACGGACLMGAIGPVAATAAAAEPQPAAPAVPIRFSLNMGTLLGHKLPLAEEVEIAAKAGYQGIEPWIRNLQQHVESGRSLSDLRRRIADLGLVVENAIGFASWIVDDDAERAKGLEQLKVEMNLISQLGGRRIAAPPAGAHDVAGMDLRRIAERYRAILELGERLGVTPQLEIWGGSKTLSRMSEAAFVATEAAHPNAAVLLDVFHIYKSGSGFAGLKMFSSAAMHVFHVNDYPADPPREKATDADRVFPGLGVAPLTTIFRTLCDVGFSGALSLELFNRTYWKADPLTVARVGLERMQAAVKRAMAAQR